MWRRCRNLAELTQLEELEITTMKSLPRRRLDRKGASAPLPGALGLQEPDAASFECLVGHPALKRLNFGVGRLKDNDAIAAMFFGGDDAERELTGSRPALFAAADAVALGLRGKPASR